MENKKFFTDYIWDSALDSAYATLEEKCGEAFAERLSDKAVDTLAVAAVTTTYVINDETKQLLAESFSDTLNADEINKIISTDKQTLHNILNAAKELNEYVKDDDILVSYTCETELDDAEYTKNKIREITNFIEQQTQRITNVESAPQQKQQTRERKHDIIDF